MQFEEITYREDGPIGTITLNRPHDGNMFTPKMCTRSGTASTRSGARPARG
jgi:enoyl-CoA hydratase/carnithine racemase